MRLGGVYSFIYVLGCFKTPFVKYRITGKLLDIKAAGYAMVRDTALFVSIARRNRLASLILRN